MQFIVNKNVKKIMSQKGLRQKAVAAKIGMKPVVLSNICRCKRHVYADEVLAIATALQCSIEDLFQEVSA